MDTKELSIEFLPFAEESIPYKEAIKGITVEGVVKGKFSNKNVVEIIVNGNEEEPLVVKVTTKGNFNSKINPEQLVIGQNEFIATIKVDDVQATTSSSVMVAEDLDEDEVKVLHYVNTKFNRIAIPANYGTEEVDDNEEVAYHSALLDNKMNALKNYYSYRMNNPSGRVHSYIDALNKLKFKLGLI